MVSAVHSLCLYLLCVKGTIFASDALADDLGILVNEDCGLLGGCRGSEAPQVTAAAGLWQQAREL